MIFAQWLNVIWNTEKENEKKNRTDVSIHWGDFRKIRKRAYTYNFYSSQNWLQPYKWTKVRSIAECRAIEVYSILWTPRIFRAHKMLLWSLFVYRSYLVSFLLSFFRHLFFYICKRFGKYLFFCFTCTVLDKRIMSRLLKQQEHKIPQHLKRSR